VKLEIQNNKLTNQIALPFSMCHAHGYLQLTEKSKKAKILNLNIHTSKVSLSIVFELSYLLELSML
jgi:hypothetical protein